MNLNCYIWFLRTCFCICLGLVSQSPLAAAPVSVEVFIQTNGGGLARYVSSPVKVVDLDGLASHFWVLNPERRSASYDSFFSLLPPAKGVEESNTDSSGRLTLPTMDETLFLVVRNSPFDNRDDYLWIVPSTEVREGKAYFELENMGLEKFIALATSNQTFREPFLEKLKHQADEMFKRENFQAVKAFARHFRSLGDLPTAQRLIQTANKAEVALPLAPVSSTVLDDRLPSPKKTAASSTQAEKTRQVRK